MAGTYSDTSNFSVKTDPSPICTSPIGRAGALIRRERLARDWSLKGLAHGICAVSYLSKIERGEADPSPEIRDALLERLGVDWHDDEAFLAQARDLLDRGYDAVLSLDEAALPGLRDELAAMAPDLAGSPLAAEAALLEGLLAEPRRPVGPELEVLLDNRLLGLQRLAQGRPTDALRLNLCALTYLEAGFSAYKTGERNYAPAIELLRRAYEAAAEEGRAHVMVSARVYLGNCYCNQLDLENMNREYAAAARLARALGEKDLLRTIGYNTASAQIECGRFADAYAFFSALEDPEPLGLHKLAVCCEGLGLGEEALAALDRVPEDADDFVLQLCDLVRFRLTHADYLRRPEYGEALLAAFERCQEELPIGFAAFHLPRVLEWHTANRQYRAAYELARDFPLRLPPRPAATVEYDGAKGVQ